MAIQKKKRGPAPARRSAGKKRTGTAGAVRGIALSFLCGVGCCLLLLCGAALAFAHTALPLALARPLACAAAAGGAFVSGLVLGRSWGRRKLLAGLGCGGFYCACLLLSSLVAGAPRSRVRVNCRCWRLFCWAVRQAGPRRRCVTRPGRGRCPDARRKNSGHAAVAGRPRRKGCRKHPAAGAGGRGVPGAPQTAAAG